MRRHSSADADPTPRTKSCAGRPQPCEPSRSGLTQTSCESVGLHLMRQESVLHLTVGVCPASSLPVVERYRHHLSTVSDAPGALFVVVLVTRTTTLFGKHGLE